MQRRLAWPAAMAVGLLGLVPGLACANETVVVMTKKQTVEPAQVEIKAGDTVVFRNESVTLQTIATDASKAADPQHAALPVGATPFVSPHILPTRLYRHTFTVPGTYRYFSTMSEGNGMVGEIIVREIIVR